MQKFRVIFFLLFGLMAGLANADTFKLSTGETVVGELVLSSINDLGMQVKLEDGEYQRISWSTLSQEDLKKLSANPKLRQYVDPFIYVSQEERLKQSEVKPVAPARLDRPARRSLLSAMFSSSLGLVVVLVLYAANIFAGREVAVYRGKPVGLVCGVSAVLPLIGPLIFLALSGEPKSAAEAETAEEAQPTETTSNRAGTAAAAAAPAAGRPAPAPATAAVAPAADDLNPMRDETVAHPTSLHLAHETPAKIATPAPAETRYQRGQFTFNRRFFETRFPGFFGVVRKESEKGMVLVFKTARGEYIGERITRITSNDLHLEVHKGNATEEIMIPFTDVKEVLHKKGA